MTYSRRRGHLAKDNASLLVLTACLSLATPVASLAGDWILNPTTGHYYRLTDGRYYGIVDASGCPDGSGSYAPDCYRPTWIDAEAEAQGFSSHAHLVTINDQAENDWLVATFGGGVEFFTGFTDHSLYSSEGNWVWVSGEPVTYSHWDGASPDDAHDGEDCAHINHICCTGAGWWNDLGNDIAFYPHHPDLPLRAIIETPTLDPTAAQGTTWGLLKVRY